jgi:hypothetical protein
MREPLIARLPVIFVEPEMFAEPVRVRVSIEENVELPETIREPFIMAPLDAVTDENWALLPLNITLFQVGNSYSVLTVIGFVVQYI